MGDMVADLVCILEHASVTSAICVGYVIKFPPLNLFSSSRLPSLQARLGRAGLSLSSTDATGPLQSSRRTSPSRKSTDIFDRLSAPDLTRFKYISSAGPFIPIAHLVPAFPNLAYNLYFEANTTEAAAELNKNITRSVRGVLRTVDSPPPASFLKSTDSFLAAWNDVEIVCKLLYPLRLTSLRGLGY